MTIQFDATFRDGAIHPAQPLQLPENTPVHVVVTPKIAGQPMTREEILAIRPKSPRITVEEFDAIIKKYAVHVGSLPADFSREDIYSDHD
jgi:hypothetical protein